MKTASKFMINSICILNSCYFKSGAVMHELYQTASQHVKFYCNHNFIEQFVETACFCFTSLCYVQVKKIK